ncbi:Asx homology domain-containing protein [Aspergillus egyptiacus]|nr:Asx homology domain-containing protein [Aspergillus egyptiacus]
MDSTNTKQKRNPRRAAKDRWEEEKLLTSDKSQLIDLDLVKLLARPEAWECLEDDEKREILALLPENVYSGAEPPSDEANSKIPSIPQSFLRYSNHWRDAIRNFQIDLQNGRYDPQWQREAEEAVQQRAAGKFDNFKEREFEEFWGQKQTMDRSVAAGESSRVKLSTLIEHGVVRKGDVWKWSRSFNKPKTLIEKEARITDIKGHLLTFAVPPGQRVFLPVAPSGDTNGSATMKKLENGATAPPLSPPKESTAVEAETGSDTKTPEAGPSRKRSAEPEAEATVAKRPRGRPLKKQPATSEVQTCDLKVETANPPPENKNVKSLSDTEDKVESSEEHRIDHSQSVDEAAVEKLGNAESSSSDSTKDVEADEIIIPNIQGPTALTLKILEIDGRVKKATNGNAWKEIRCFRNNQDMGTLWEVRQAWYVKAK